jgi:REP element-mobilizing transposase RayT
MAAKTYLWYHFIVTTKYRRPVINHYTETLIHNCALLKSEELGAEIIEWKSGPDLAHIHLIATLPADLSPAAYMNRIKGFSAFIVRQCAARKQNGMDHMSINAMGMHFWGHAYFCKTLGAGSLEAAKKYVADQWAAYREKKAHAAPPPDAIASAPAGPA